MARVELVRVSPVIEMSGGGRLADSPEGMMTPDAAEALAILHDYVRTAGSPFKVTSCFRDLATQKKAYARYIAWVTAGKPPRMLAAANGLPARPNPRFDAVKMKPDLVAKPGFSFHNAGRAVDISVRSLAFPVIPRSLQLDRLWELATPLGFRPIIRAADENASEAWHFDFMGPWRKTYDRVGYADAAMAACLDIGGSGYGSDAEREIQAHLHRLGKDCGKIDGVIGAKTREALRVLAPETQSVEKLLPLLRSM